MAIYAISDLHLSLASPKPMDIFGPAWENHAEKLRRNWERVVTDADTVLMPGDLSWAMRFSEAEPDLSFVANLPGTKILIRGNHDYWWHRQATSRIQRIVDRNMIFLQGTSVMVGDVGVTGTRGWRLDWETAGGENGRKGEWEKGRAGDGETRGRGDKESRGQDAPSPLEGEETGTHGAPSPLEGEGRGEGDNPQSKKVLARELAYLERGIQSIPESAKCRIVMLHFPPFDERLQPNEFARMLTRHSVDILVYGHVHAGLGLWLDGVVDGVRYYMVSADIVKFTPQLILP
jgi:hypothetical protein